MARLGVLDTEHKRPKTIIRNRSAIINSVAHYGKSPAGHNQQVLLCLRRRSSFSNRARRRPVPQVGDIHPACSVLVTPYGFTQCSLERCAPLVLTLLSSFLVATILASANPWSSIIKPAPHVQIRCAAFKINSWLSDSTQRLFFHDFLFLLHFRLLLSKSI